MGIATPPSGADDQRSLAVEQAHEATQIDQSSPMKPITSLQPTLPPELRTRPPLPAPPSVVNLLSPLNGGQVKDPISWRTRAYKLRTEGGESLVKASRTFPASFAETLAALTSACSNQNISVESVFESAGQVLVHPNEGSLSKTRIIFSLKPLSKTSTMVRVGLDADTRSINDKLIDDLLARMDVAISQKGLL